MWLVSFCRRHSRRLVAGLATSFAFAFSPAHSSSAESVAVPSIRWHVADALPLRVWIQPARRADGSGAEFSENVHAAFAAWSSVGPIEFDIAFDSATADVRVYSAPLALVSSDGRSVDALTHCEVDDSSRIVRADIVVAMRRPNGRTLSREALNALLVHEVGHALGLQHSPDSTSVMFSTVRVDGLSATDVASVRALYGKSATHAAVLEQL